MLLSSLLRLSLVLDCFRMVALEAQTGDSHMQNRHSVTVCISCGVRLSVPLFLTWITWPRSVALGVVVIFWLPGKNFSACERRKEQVRDSEDGEDSCFLTQALYIYSPPYSYMPCGYTEMRGIGIRDPKRFKFVVLRACITFWLVRWASSRVDRKLE